MVALLLDEYAHKPPNGTRFSRREASASKRSGRLEALVSPLLFYGLEAHLLKSSAVNVIPKRMYLLIALHRSGLTVGLSGSGGADKTPSPKNCPAGSRHMPGSGEATVRCKRR